MVLTHSLVDPKIRSAFTSAPIGAQQQRALDQRPQPAPK